MRMSKDGDEEEDEEEERWRPALFFFSRWLYIYIYSQKAVLRNKSARIKWALCFSIAIIQPKFMKNRQISIHGGSSR